MKIYLATIILLVIYSCAPLKYKGDFGVMSSLRANNPEYPLIVNNLMCVDGINETGGSAPGFCVLRLRRAVETFIKIMPMPYAYKLSIVCTPSLMADYETTVPADTYFPTEDTVHTIAKPVQYNNIKRDFSCSVYITPRDGRKEAGLFAKFYVNLVDPEYVELPQMGQYEKWYVFGENAFVTRCLTDEGKFVTFRKKTGVKICEKKPCGVDEIDYKLLTCYSESEASRSTFAIFEVKK